MKSSSNTSVDGVLWAPDGKTELGDVNVVCKNASPVWSPEDVLTIGRKDGGKIPGGTYLLDCGPNGKYKVQGPGDSPNIATNSLVAGVQKVF